MMIGAAVILFAVFFYLLVRGATQGRDRTLEDQAQAEYLRFLDSKKRRNEKLRSYSILFGCPQLEGSLLFSRCCAIMGKKLGRGQRHVSAACGSAAASDIG